MNRMRRAFAAVACSVTLAPIGLAAQVDRSLAPQVDALFAEYDRPDSPGVALLVVQDGKVLYKRGYGSAVLEYQIPITSSTVFDIASVSKQFAGMAVAMLVERGAISLDDDIRMHIPEVPDFGYTITVRHLVHHVSGIRDWPGTLAIAGWRMDDVISFEQILTMAWNQQDLNFEPGAEYLYSNTGYNLLAELVARVSGQSFREWTDANIFQPLAMTSTHFHDDHRELVTNRAYGYTRTGDRYRYVPNGLTALGSSSLFTTIDDLEKWVINFDDPRVGGAAVIGRMHERGVLNDGERIAYAYGLNVGEYRGLATAGHGGSWAGFRTRLLRFPQQRFSVVVLSNFSSFNPTRSAYQVADLFLADHLAPRESSSDARADAEAPIIADAAVLDDFAGMYRLGPGWMVTITREDDRLMTQATAEPKFAMTPRAADQFHVDAYGAAIHFRRDATSRVTHFEYRGIYAPRVEPLVPTGKELSEFEGEYYSEELGTAYTIVAADSGLVATHRRHADIHLTPLIRDEFRGSVWFVRGVEFVRGAAGQVTGLMISNGRSRNLRFKKIQ